MTARAIWSVCQGSELEEPSQKKWRTRLGFEELCLQSPKMLEFCRPAHAASPDDFVWSRQASSLVNVLIIRSGSRKSRDKIIGVSMTWTSWQFQWILVYPIVIDWAFWLFLPIRTSFSFLPQENPNLAEIDTGKRRGDRWGPFETNQRPKGASSSRDHHLELKGT